MSIKKKISTTLRAESSHQIVTVKITQVNIERASQFHSEKRKNHLIISECERNQAVWSERL